MTTCVYERRCILGRVEHDHVNLSPLGTAVANCWRDLPSRFDQIRLEDWVVMPNHFHAILRVQRHYLVHLGRIMSTFKATSAVQVNAIRGTPGAHLWQRGYFDRVIRDGTELERIRRYIRENPLRWSFDHLNPERR